MKLPKTKAQRRAKVQQMLSGTESSAKTEDFRLTDTESKLLGSKLAQHSHSVQIHRESGQRAMALKEEIEAAMAVILEHRNVTGFAIAEVAIQVDGDKITLKVPK